MRKFDNDTKKPNTELVKVQMKKRKKIEHHLRVGKTLEINREIKVFQKST